MRLLIILFTGSAIFALAGCGRQSTMNHGNMGSNTTINHGDMMDNNANTDTQSTLSIQKDVDADLAKPTEIVTLKNGDIYEMTVTKVIKELGNAKVPMLAYNGSIPGPLLKIEKGATVTLRFTNKVKEIETLLHSHGVRVDNAMDGVARSMGGQQDPIKYGETFEYKLTFPDEGIFWYHPHVQEELQQELGLYGNYLVSDSNQVKTVHREEALMLDDILLENGKVPVFLKNGVNYSLMGRYGNIMLINGTPNYNLTMKQGEVIRLYITNVSNTRPYNFTIPGIKMKRIGGDIGLYEHEEMIDSLIIGPAERYIIDIMANTTGSYEIINQTPEKSTTLGTITVLDQVIDTSYTQQFNNLKTNTGIILDIDPYRSLIDAPVQKSLRMSIEMSMMKGMNSMMGAKDKIKPIEWEDDMGMMNQHSNNIMTKRKLIDEKTQKQNMDINWTFNKGDKIKIRITNDKESMHPMQHPMHFHGQRFLVISRNGTKQTNLVWKDTVLIPAGEYVDIILDASNPGTRMAHCHIAEHLSAGMMMKFEVK